MRHEIAPNCDNCPLKQERERMLENWRSFEEEVDANPAVELVAEGVFKCDGPKRRSIGPLVLGFTCDASDYEQPQVENTPVS